MADCMLAWHKAAVRYYEHSHSGVRNRMNSCSFQFNPKGRYIFEHSRRIGFKKILATFAVDVDGYQLKHQASWISRLFLMAADATILRSIRAREVIFVHAAQGCGMRSLQPCGSEMSRKAV
jgi:hypothetical protein